MSTSFRKFVFFVLCGVWSGGGIVGEPVALSYAKNFSIENFDSYKLLTVRNAWKGANNIPFVYALVPKHSAAPVLPANAQIVRVPVERMSILETVYLAHVQALDLYENLIGMAYLNYASDEKAIAQVKNGYTKTISSGATLDIESILMLKSDLILTSAIGDPQFDAHPALQRAKQPVAVTAGYMEEHPLGRAEWIKFTAAFFCKENEAAEIFDGIAARYERLTQLTQDLDSRPSVIANAPYGGIWHVPGGKSFTAKLISDAGGDYVFAKDHSTGGVPKDIESIFYNATDADFWIHPGPARLLREVLGQDERFSRLKAFQNGNVYNNTLRIGDVGGNDAWERGVLHPEEILADLIAIFHPEILPDHEFAFYERLQ